MILINNKRIWPAFVPPQKNELFSSWICRISAEHQVKPHTFIRNYLEGFDSLFNRNIDILKPDSIIQTIKNHTPLKFHQIEDLFLTSYKGIVAEKIISSSFTRGILPLGVFHRKRTNFGTLYCPSCLSKFPYFKKEWRLSFSLICLECKTRLKEKCDRCNSPIAYHLINKSKVISNVQFPKPLNICSCGHDLATPNFNDLMPSKIELEYQKLIDNTLHKGYNKMTNYSFLFFDVLILLATKYLSPYNLNFFRENLLKYTQRAKLPYYKADFGLCSLDIRRIALLDVYNLFRDYPFKLKDFFKVFPVAKSYLRFTPPIPYWFLKEVYYS